MQQERAKETQPITLPPGGSRVVVVIPAGKKHKTERNILSIDGVPVDYKV
jgi:hypothetical protein